MLISPADYVIRKLGGLTAAAGKIKTEKWPAGLPVTTVQGWKTRGRIPQDHWSLCIEAAKADGETVELMDFLNDHDAPDAKEAEQAA